MSVARQAVAFGIVMAFWFSFLCWLNVPAQSHEWFSRQRNPVSGVSCCNGSDCHLIETSEWWEERGLIFVRWAGKTWSMPASQSQPSQDKTGKAVACIWNGALRCFFMPVNF